jgi:6-phosphogluconolactonase
MKSRGKVWLSVIFCVVALAVVLIAPLQTAAQEFIYTSNFGDGTISGFSVDPVNGRLTEVPGSPFPSGVGSGPLNHSPDGHFLYVALTEQLLGRPCGDNPAEVISYGIEPHTGTLTPLDHVTLPDFCSTDVITDPSGKFVYVASIHFDPEKFGEIDGFEASAGTLTPLPGSPFASPIQVSAGQNPAIQSLAMTHDGKVLYASDPNDAAGILIFDRDTRTGALVFRSAFNSGSAFGPMAITPSGRFLIAMPPIFLGNGGNGVYEYAIGANGDLTPVPDSPFAAIDSGFATALSISPNGNFVASAGAGGVSVQRETPHGNLSLVPGSPFGGGLPLGITFDQSGRFVYVPGTVFKINRQTGVLTKVSEFTAGGLAEAITAVTPCERSHEGSNDRRDANGKHDVECHERDRNHKRD